MRKVVFFIFGLILATQINAYPAQPTLKVGEYDHENRSLKTGEEYCSYCQRYRLIAFHIVDEDQKRNVCSACIIKALDGELNKS